MKNVIPASFGKMIQNLHDLIIYSMDIEVDKLCFFTGGEEKFIKDWMRGFVVLVLLCALLLYDI